MARIAVIGSRATDRLLGAYASARETPVKVNILRALEPIATGRALPIACEALQQGGDVAVAAASVLKPLLHARETSSATAALDVLVETALDPARDRRVRLAAYAALQDMPADIVTRIGEALELTVDRATRQEAAHEALFADACDGRLPDDPTELRSAVLSMGSEAALGSLHSLIEAVRSREQSTKATAGRTAWQEVRGAAHHVLALRGSRIAVYDLRETLEAADAALPPSFLSALRGVGDVSCVEALAGALARAPAQDLWWRHQLASALRGIARRERITKRHAAMKRALARWPQAADALL
jgi:hypothetical protein